MSTIHEVANALRALDQPSQITPSSGSMVTGVEPTHATVDGRRVQGYALLGAEGNAVAFIEVTAYHSPIMHHLRRLIGLRKPARHVVRGLLNAEDYTSTMYDLIVRVHYVGGFSL